MEITMYIDTSYKYLAVGLSKDNKLVYKKQYIAFKKQSEYAALEIKECLDKTNTKASELTRIVVCNGPGSYTGIRIGLTLAKVMAASLNIELVTLSSLIILSGLKENVMPLIDARSNRAYVAIYNKGEIIKEETVLELEEIKLIKDKYELVGDSHLLNVISEEVDLIENMFLLSRGKESVDVTTAKAIYLKEY
ncbi:TPA: tRNA (adenosine(37)-N6)-threonylcarbamoyltransferase complex dimerization subunit type 1 TsaB [bacterium]|jgi:tRNA threonylcarbamoyl adenosine modification protein YeaZ|nr:tRNA (adenosine(37)-N6)-threonylcarbamoyltransferase complex dimerization subunit type 1 TsaB [bacterium]